jgi:hypothetical protein
LTSVLGRKDLTELSVGDLRGLLQAKTMEIIEAQEEFRREADFGITDSPRTFYARKVNRQLSMSLSRLHKEFRLISNAYDNALTKEAL